MAPIVRTRLRALRRCERGWTLIELLMCLLIFMLVIGAALSLGETSEKISRKDVERANAMQEQRAGLYRMVRELRQAYNILGTTSRSIEFLVVNPAGQSRHVRYSCGDDNPGKCVRYETPIGQPLPATGTTVISRVLNWGGNVADLPVFDFTDTNPTTPSYVKVRIEVPAKGERASGYNNRLILDDGFYARNMRITGFQQ